MNILFTCAGRRNYLLQYFRDALSGTGKIIGVDSDINATALQEVDVAREVPSVHEEDYIDSVLQVCVDNNVSGIFSLNDIELPILVANRGKFTDEGVALFISGSEIIDICSAKVKTAKFLMENGFHTPKTFVNLEDAIGAIENGSLAFPLIVKPRWGSASIGIRRVNSNRELELAFQYTLGLVSESVLAKVGQIGRLSEERVTDGGSVIVQEWIDGEEYGLDVLNDLAGNFNSVYCKRKMGMRAGETDRAILVDSSELESMGRRLGETLGHIGNLDVDVFKSNADGRYLVLEMNPRFGGGYPFSHELGARYPQALLAWAASKSFDTSIQTKSFNKIISKCERLIEIRHPEM